MIKFWALINLRTLFTLSAYMLASFFTLRYNLKFHHTTILFGLLIVFPLVKSYQFAFKRRERALEYLCLFKGCLIAVYNFLLHVKKLPTEHKTMGMELVKSVSEALLNHLKTGKPEVSEVYQQLDRISEFMQRYRKEISGKTVTLIIRTMKEVYTSAAFLISVKSHQTVLLLRIFALIFINLFALIQAPTLNYTFEQSPIIIYSLTFFTGLILITLYNVLDQLENPFDQSGYDDINLEEFRLELTPPKVESRRSDEAVAN